MSPEQQHIVEAVVIVVGGYVILRLIATAIKDTIDHFINRWDWRRQQWEWRTVSRCRRRLG